MAETGSAVTPTTETLYNFGVLTKRYELVSRTAAQFGPGVVGVVLGIVMIVMGVPVPAPFVPVLLGFWFALGRVPVGRHKGTRIRSMVAPLVRHGSLRVRGQATWHMPETWLSIASASVAPEGVGPDRVALAAVAFDDGNPVLVDLALANGPTDTDRTRRTNGDRRRLPQGGGRQGGERRSGKQRGRQLTRPGREQLPPELGRLRWLSTMVDGTEAGLLSERTGRRHLVTAVIAVYGGDRFVFSGPDEQAAQISRWGEVLAGMTGSGRGLRRLQWVERATPQPATAQEDWSRAAMTNASADELADYHSLRNAIGTAAIHHEVFLGAQVVTEATGVPEAVAETTDELAQLCEHLTSIGLRPLPLSRRGIAALCRQWADPTTAERLALWGDGSIPISQAGPSSRHVGYDVLRTDGYFHRVGHIAAWPRIDVGTEWMYPLLAAATPGSVRTVTMHLEAVSTEAAFQEVRDARTTGGMAQRKRDDKGIITTEEEERRTTEARSRERELTRGFRQHKIAGLVMVSSPAEDTVNQAWRQAERKAIECHLDLREVHGRGHVAWAGTLPLCRLRFARGLL